MTSQHDPATSLPGSRRRTETAAEIISFEPRYAGDFERLNLEWLNRYFRVEAVDGDVLSRPLKILSAGGGRELFLESNSRLKPAPTLYESAGFVHAPRPFESHYERADIYMVYRAAGAGKPA